MDFIQSDTPTIGVLRLVDGRGKIRVMETREGLIITVTNAKDERVATLEVAALNFDK
jgi:hypothetical protein